MVGESPTEYTILEGFGAERVVWAHPSRIVSSKVVLVAVTEGKLASEASSVIVKTPVSVLRLVSTDI